MNDPCPKIPGDIFGTCAEECGEYGYMECDNITRCCPNPCGAHICLNGNVSLTHLYLLKRLDIGRYSIIHVT